MDRLKMHTPDLAEENFKKLAALFPNAVTEKKNENGEVVRAIDADILRQEISAAVVEGPQERYQFTWPDKKKAIILSNTPIAKTLRLDREKSVGRDGTPGGIDTENIYIEGDNLDALKLLQETYLGKVKMIYIDPPYNTGDKDNFIYMDNFSQERGEYLDNSGQFDEEGNRLVPNLESNGRFHTDWLNMIYPRLKVARDLLSKDGVIFISIDDNEQGNLKKICDEIFGSNNFIAIIIRNTNSSKNQSLFISVSHEYCLIYAKNIEILKSKHAENKWGVMKNNVDEYIRRVKQLQKAGLSTDEITEELKTLTKYPRFIDFTNYWYFDEHGLYRKGDLGGVPNGSKVPIFNPLTGKDDPIPPGGFRFNHKKMEALVKEGRIHFHTDGSLPTIKRYLSENMTQRPKSIMSDDQRPDAALMGEFNTPFDNPKQLAFIKRIVSIIDNDSIIMDFFSGSATTAHAVMQLNAEDGGSRKFIMVQIPEACDEKKEAYKAGYRNVCEIGEERIRRAGKKIKEETGADIDYGFRVFRVDSSNMEDVYYRPDQYISENRLSNIFAENIKPDRTPEDLLIQVMLDLGVPLSSDIEESEIGGKRVFSVAGGYLIACFDSDVTEETVKAIAQMRPCCAVFRDSGMAGDSVIANFEQIFETYSPKTQRKVL